MSLHRKLIKNAIINKLFNHGKQMYFFYLCEDIISNAIVSECGRNKLCFHIVLNRKKLYTHAHRHLRVPSRHIMKGGVPWYNAVFYCLLLIPTSKKNTDCTRLLYILTIPFFLYGVCEGFAELRVSSLDKKFTSIRISQSSHLVLHCRL